MVRSKFAGSDPVRFENSFFLVLVWFGSRIQIIQVRSLDHCLKLNVMKMDGPTEIFELDSGCPGANLMSVQRCHVVTNDVT